MRIDGIGNININKSQNINNETDISFKKVMDNKTMEKNIDKFNRMLDEIKESGEKLADKKTIENLFDYKNKVKAFIEEAINNGVNLDKRGGFRRGGRSRVLKVVSKIDDKLVDLTDEIINKERKGLNILKIVGEIEGLLLNIYA